jgi:hypothetical protein
MIQIKNIYRKLRNSRGFLYVVLIVGAFITLVGICNSAGSVQANNYAQRSGGLNYPSLRIRYEIKDTCELCNDNIEIMPGNNYINDANNNAQERVHYTLIQYLLDKPKGNDLVYYDTYDIAAFGILMTGLAVIGIITRKSKV